eukprot:1327663-Amphidinium_carterae.1
MAWVLRTFQQFQFSRPGAITPAKNDQQKGYQVDLFSSLTSFSVGVVVVIVVVVAAESSAFELGNGGKLGTNVGPMDSGRCQQKHCRLSQSAAQVR